MKKVRYPSHVHQSAVGVLDPKVYSSCLCECIPTPIPEIVKGAIPGPEVTMRDWKRQQMQLAGQQCRSSAA
jgi:hypothetical protein